LADFATTNPSTTVEYLGADSNNPSMHTYGFKTLGGQEAVKIDIAPNIMKQAVANPNHPEYAEIIKYLGFQELNQGPDRGVVRETILPGALEGAVGALPGLAVDLPNALVHSFGEIPVSVLKWVAGGGEGSLVEAAKQRYITSANPFLGSKYVTKKVQEGASAVAKELEGTNFEFLNTLLFDMDLTPDESTRARKALSIISQAGGAAGLEGGAIIGIVEKLAKGVSSITPRNVLEVFNKEKQSKTSLKEAAQELAAGSPSQTFKNVSETLSDLQARRPIGSLALETAAGSMAGAGMVYGPEMLPEGTPKWIKDASAAGFGVLAPAGGIVTGTALFNVINNAPLLSMPRKFVKGLGDVLYGGSIERTAASSLLMTGGQNIPLNKGKILSIRDQLSLAQSLGRTMDPDTRLAYTLPQMARNEAKILQAELNMARENRQFFKDSEIDALETKVSDLTVFADFQEGQMAKIFGDSEIAADVYRLHSSQVIDRATTIKEALDDVIFKTDLGGEPSPPDQRFLVDDDWNNNQASGYIYGENRRRALIEGRPLSVGETSISAVRQALDNLYGKFETESQAIINSAEQRIKSIRDGVSEETTPDDRASFDLWIRSEIESAYSEIDGLESLIWNKIQGLDVPKTKKETTVTADGQVSDVGPALMLGDKTVSEYFADRVKDLEAGTSENQSKYLFKLAGREALVEKELATNPNSKEAKAVLRARETLADLDASTEKLAKSRLPGYRGKPLSLLEFLSERGGIRGNEKVPDAGGGDLPTEGSFRDIGELFGQDADKWHQGKRFKKLVLDINSNRTTERERWQEAMTLDEALTAVRQEGYQITGKFDTGSTKDAPETIDINDLTNAIKEELDGNKIYRADDADAVLLRGQEIEVAENNIRFLDELGDQLGIDARGINPETNRTYTAEEILDLRNFAESQDAGKPLGFSDYQRRVGELEAAENNLIAKNTANISDETGAVDLLKAGEIQNTGELGVRIEGDVSIGRTAQEVQNVLSNLKRSLRMEEGKRVPDNKKIANTNQLIDELNQVIDQNFPDLNQDMLGFSRNVSRIKNRLFSGPLADIMKRSSTGDLKIETPAVGGKILPLGTSGKGVDAQTNLTALNNLRNAMTSVTTNDAGGPFIRNPDTNELSINPEANWAEISKNPPSPFVQESIPRRGLSLDETMDPSGVPTRELGLSVQEGTPVNPDTIKIVEGLLWRRFNALAGKAGEPFNSSSALKFIDDNDQAIKWLEKATGEPSGFKDLAAAEVKSKALQSLGSKRVDELVQQQKEAGSFDETFTETSFRDLADSLDTRTKNLMSAQTFLEADPHQVGNQFLIKIEKSSNPSQEINEILKVLESGRLEDGSNPALEGFKTAVAEALFRQSLSGPDAIGPIGDVAKQLLSSTKTDVRFLDGAKLRNRLDNGNIIQLVSALYGNHAPDLLRKFAMGADDVSLIPTKPLPSERVLAGTKVQDEVIANMGRMLGIKLAGQFPTLLNPLMAAGMGRRIAIGVARELKGKGMERHVLEALLDPNYGLSLMKRFSDMTTPEKQSFTKKMLKWAHSDLLREPFQNMKARGFTLPGAAVEIIEQAPDAQDLIPEDTEEVSSLSQPVSAISRPSRAPEVAALNLRPPQPGSLLDKVSPVFQGGSPMGTGSGPTAQGTPERGRAAFGAMDTVFRANKGGLVSLCGPGKPRQMVS